MAKCNTCSTEFDANIGEEQAPCPVCGAISRFLQDGITPDAHVRDHAILELRGNDQTIGFRESERDGRTTSADEDNGCVSTAVIGTAPQGETDSLTVSRILVKKKNLLGDSWNEPREAVKQDSDIDCVATNANDVKLHLQIQVVRGIVVDRWWRQMSVAGTNELLGTVDEFADHILEAVSKKCNLPLRQRSELVLAIDANRLPGLTFDSVVNHVREKDGVTLAAFGFQGIWIVGPSATRTYRLDNTDTPIVGA